MLRTRSRLIAATSAAALVLAACGGDDGDTPDETVDDVDTEDTVGDVEGGDEDSVDAPDTATESEEDDADDTADDTGDDTGDDAAASDQPLAVTGTNDLVWDVEELSAPAGTIEFELTCDAAMHDLVIEETDDEVAECGPEETTTGSVELDEGTYTYICTVPGHGNMRGTLNVT